MRKLVILFAGLCCVRQLKAQGGEFTVYSNGLIYNEFTMNKLTRIVDSLNLAYRSCNFDRVFHSKSQVIGHLVVLDSGNIKEARRDLKDQIPLDDFLRKYPEAQIQKDVLIVKWKYTNYRDQEIVEFRRFDENYGDGFSIQSENLSLYRKDLTKKWLYEYTEKSTYRKESLSAFYFPSNFISASLPEKYARLIGYADCLIDTNTTKFAEELTEGRIGLPDNWITLSARRKEELLEKMRSTRVVGFCSMDPGPRNHAVNIALLSADTYNWGVFLKAHLDIMNDRFERNSDGSYAWGQRKTYIRELESLNINVSDLVLGISFRLENPAINHYFGDIGRIGRALSETKNRAEIEQSILSIISDKDLDLFNRLLFYFLFRNYNYYIGDEIIKNENRNKLAVAIRTFPDYLRDRIKAK